MTTKAFIFVKGADFSAQKFAVSTRHRQGAPMAVTGCYFSDIGDAARRAAE